jgi:hypothetical protein
VRCNLLACVVPPTAFRSPSPPGPVLRILLPSMAKRPHAALCQRITLGQYRTMMAMSMDYIGKQYMAQAAIAAAVLTRFRDRGRKPSPTRRRCRLRQISVVPQHCCGRAAVACLGRSRRAHRAGSCHPELAKDLCRSVRVRFCAAKRCSPQPANWDTVPAIGRPGPQSKTAMSTGLTLKIGHTTEEARIKFRAVYTFSFSD